MQLPTLVTNCLINLIDVTLAFEESYSILVEIVAIDAEKRVDNNLVQIWKLEINFCSYLEPKVWSRF